MKKLALIPARGGSKRIPRKNIRTFLGKPIIAYSIEAALEAEIFDEVMVSTEDEQIAQVAAQYGAKVPFLRSAKTADDFATTVEVIEEVLLNYQSIGLTFDVACCIYATAPFVTTNLLQTGYQKLVKQQFDTVFSVLPFSFPIQRALKKDENDQVALFAPQYLNSRSQDLEKAYHDAGQFYWFRTKALLENRKLWTDNTGCIVLSELQAHDIDSEEDWKIAELKYQLQHATK